MKTLFSSLVLAVAGIIATIVWGSLASFAGLPGAVIAGGAPSRDTWRFRLGFGLIVAGQAYVSLAFAAWVTAWTRLASARPDVTNVVLWPIAFVAVVGPVWLGLLRARFAARESGITDNPQLEALGYTLLAIIVGVVVFGLFPRAAVSAWSWVPLVKAAAGQ